MANGMKLIGSTEIAFWFGRKVWSWVAAAFSARSYVTDYTLSARRVIRHFPRR
jgi:hypothetical protein